MGKVKNENFITVSGWMVNDLHLKGNELLIYAIIYGFTQDGETLFSGSQKYLADWISGTKVTVRNALSSLENKGLIEKTETHAGGIKLCRYRVKNLPTGLKINPNNIDISISNIDNTNKYNIGVKNLPTGLKINPVIEGDFFKFWDAYPRKVNKAGALKAYKAVADDIDINDLLTAVENAKKSQQWKAEGGRFIPYPVTYLNQRRYNDELQPAADADTFADYFEKAARRADSEQG